MLDTDTASYIIKGGHYQVDRRVAATPPQDVCISAMTRAELKYGLAALPTKHRLHALVLRFLKNTRLLAWDAAAADYHAEIKHQLWSTGKPIGDMDTFIAAHAIAADAVLVTNDTRHFERIKLPLMLENWTQYLLEKDRFTQTKDKQQQAQKQIPFGNDKQKWVQLLPVLL